MNNSISNQIIISTYRILSIVLVLLPVILNIIISGDLATSLIYSPMLSLFLAFSLVSLDKKLNVCLAKAKNKRIMKSNFLTVKQQMKITFKLCDCI